MDSITKLMASLGQEVEDAEEEAFLLFSQDIPSSNLGFLDSRSDDVDVSVHGQDYTLRQSPTVLASKRQGGTTGAVLWKITPVFAEWICTKDTVLWSSSLLGPGATVVELGCGVSGLLALSLAPSVSRYVATDQEYVQRILKENLEANIKSTSNNNNNNHRNSNNIQRNRARKSNTAAKLHSPSPLRNSRARNQAENNNNKPADAGSGTGNITFVPLDWETDSSATLKGTTAMSSPRRHRSSDSPPQDGDDHGFDLVLACDCIYNEALVAPFLSTCVDICRLRQSMPFSGEEEVSARRRPTVCIIAQQLRSYEVFEEWTRKALVDFRVWRIDDGVLGKKLCSGSGYAVHALLLRGN